MQKNIIVVITISEPNQQFEEIINSVINQTYYTKKIFVVNNGVADLDIQTNNDYSVINFTKKLPYNRAVNLAVNTIKKELTIDDSYWYWFLNEDTKADLAAIESLNAHIAKAPSVGLAGPKIMSYKKKSYVRQLGQSLTKTGQRWHILTDELDQGQHDDKHDIMGVSSIAMFVKASIFEDLGGFDSALKVVDAGLELSMRARLAGYRVVIVPEAKVYHAGDLLLASKTRSIARFTKWQYYHARKAQLYRRIVYGNTLFSLLNYLLLLPTAVVFGFIWFIAKNPKHMFEEIAASFMVFVNIKSIIKSRNRISKTAKLSKAVITQLYIDKKNVQNQKILTREKKERKTGYKRVDYNFFSSGGFALFLVFTGLSVAVFWNLIGKTPTELSGITLLPDSYSDVIRSYFYDNDISKSYALLMLSISSFTFWQPSLSLMLLLFFSFPLAALSAWTMAARFSKKSWARICLAIVWALSPNFIFAIQEANFSAILVHLFIPVFVVSCCRITYSLSSVFLSGLILAVILVSAPSLIPAVLIILIVSTILFFRLWLKIIAIIIPSIVLLLPDIVYYLNNKLYFEFFYGSSTPSVYESSNSLQMLFGFSNSNMNGIESIIDALGIDSSDFSLIFVALIFLPVLFLVVFGSLRNSIKINVLLFTIAFTGLLSAVFSSRVTVNNNIEALNHIEISYGISLYMLALVLLFIRGLDALKKLYALAIVLSISSVILLSIPSLASLYTAKDKYFNKTYSMPAIVKAEYGANPGINILKVTQNGNNEFYFEILSGSGTTQLSRKHFLNTEEKSLKQENVSKMFSELVNLAADNNLKVIKDNNIAFVIYFDQLSKDNNEYLSVLDSNSKLKFIGESPYGKIWQTNYLNSLEQEKLKPQEKISSNIYAYIHITTILLYILYAIPIEKLWRYNTNFFPKTKSRKTK